MNRFFWIGCLVLRCFGLNFSSYCCDVQIVIGVGHVCTTERCCPSGGTATFLKLANSNTTICKCATSSTTYLIQTCAEGPTPHPVAEYTFMPTPIKWPTLSPATTSYPTSIVPTRYPTTKHPSWPHHITMSKEPTTYQPTTGRNSPTQSIVIVDQPQSNMDSTTQFYIQFLIPLFIGIILCTAGACYYVYWKKHNMHHTSDFVMLEEHTLQHAV